MGKTIHQTYRGHYKKYEITEKGLSVETKDTNEYIAYLTDYEDLGFDEVVRKYEPTRFEYFIFLSVVLNIVLVTVLLLKFLAFLWLKIVIGVAIAIALFLWAKKLFKLRKIKILEGHQNIAFFYFEQHQEEVDTFIEVLKKHRKKYLRKKYMKYDDLDDEDIQKNTYMWLYKQELITRDELRDLNDEINNNRIIGGL